MESRVQRAVELKKKGYNCAQAVACTYCDLVEIDEVTMFKITEGFGVGFGCMQGTCGAISGAAVLAGLLKSSGDLETHDTKAAVQKLSKEILTAFGEKNGATICREIKGVDTGVVLRSCPGCVEDAAALAEKILFSDK
ncbi:MAG: C-GCAxxG-C-C family protein [Oscillospiraceae bacterium]|nr:C-GCAxxG-C-C family protein [Oscillospiraceae bacterium]